jgi:hypothetical protein
MGRFPPWRRRRRWESSSCSTGATDIRCRRSGKRPCHRAGCRRPPVSDPADLVGMPSGLEKTDMWGATPVDQLWCRIQFHHCRYDGRFTPPSLGGNISYPAWRRGGLARHLDRLGPLTADRRCQLHPVHGRADDAGGGDPARLAATLERLGWRPTLSQAEGVRGRARIWHALRCGCPALVRPVRRPLPRPALGKPVAIDLLDGRTSTWERPLGTTRDTGRFNTRLDLPLPTGIFNIGGTVAAAGGVIFIAATADQHLRAFDEKTGGKLWETRLPAGGRGVPLADRQGRRRTDRGGRSRSATPRYWTSSVSRRACWRSRPRRCGATAPR